MERIFKKLCSKHTAIIGKVVVLIIATWVVYDLYTEMKQGSIFATLCFGYGVIVPFLVLGWLLESFD